MLDVLLVSQNSNERKRLFIEPTWTPEHLNILLNKEKEQSKKYSFSIKGKLLLTSLETFLKENLFQIEKTLVINYFLIKEEVKTSSPIRSLLYSSINGLFSGLNNGEIEKRTESTLEIENKFFGIKKAPILDLNFLEIKKEQLLCVSQQNGFVCGYKIDGFKEKQNIPVFNYKEDSSIARTLFSHHFYSVDWNGFIHRRDFADLKRTSNKIHNERITGLETFGSLLVTGSWDKMCKVIDQETFSLNSSFDMGSAITAMTCLFDRVICACSNGIIKKTDLRTKESLFITKTQSKWISSINVKDENTFSISSYDGKVSVFDIRSYKTIKEFFCSNKIMTHCWIEKKILTGDDTSCYRFLNL